MRRFQGSMRFFIFLPLISETCNLHRKKEIQVLACSLQKLSREVLAERISPQGGGDAKKKKLHSAFLISWTVPLCLISMLDVMFLKLALINSITLQWERDLINRYFKMIQKERKKWWATNISVSCWGLKCFRYTNAFDSRVFLKLKLVCTTNIQVLAISCFFLKQMFKNYTFSLLKYMSKWQTLLLRRILEIVLWQQ